VKLGAPVSCPLRLRSGNSLDCLNGYARQAMALEVVLQWTNHHFEELVKGSDFDVTNSASLLIARSLAAHDSAATPSKGAREVFSQKMICDVDWAAMWSS
jgi:hypothetical protein